MYKQKIKKKYIWKKIGNSEAVHAKKRKYWTNTFPLNVRGKNDLI